MIGLESANDQINMIYTPQNNNLVQEPFVEEQQNTNENAENVKAEDEEVVQIQNDEQQQQEVEIQVPAPAEIPAQNPSEKKESENGGIERASYESLEERDEMIEYKDIDKSEKVEK